MQIIHIEQNNLPLIPCSCPWNQLLCLFHSKKSRKLLIVTFFTSLPPSLSSLYSSYTSVPTTAQQLLLSKSPVTSILSNIMAIFLTSSNSNSLLTEKLLSCHLWHHSVLVFPLSTGVSLVMFAHSSPSAALWTLARPNWVQRHFLSLFSESLGISSIPRLQTPPVTDGSQVRPPVQISSLNSSWLSKCLLDVYTSRFSRDLNVMHPNRTLNFLPNPAPPVLISVMVLSNTQFLSQKL